MGFSVMTTLSLRRVTASRGSSALFTDLDLTVGAGDLLGVVGPNGCGKTTLFDIIDGRHRPDHGVVTMTPPESTVGHVRQERDSRSTESVSEFISRRTGVAAAHRRFLRCADSLSSDSAGAADYERALNRWLALGGADVEERSEATLTRLGLIDVADRSMLSLSGGQSARVELAALLLSSFDLYLLDEPTNDLDEAGIEALQSFLSQLRAPTLLISHDRDLLSHVATGILEFDPSLQQSLRYSGGYREYLREREISRTAARERYMRSEESRARVTGQIRAAEASQRRGRKHAEASYRRGRVDKLARNAMIEGATAGAQNKSRLRRQLQRMPEVDEPRKVWQLRMVFAKTPRSGETVASLAGAVARRGSFTCGPIDLHINRGDRCVIDGANGSGKSTLVAMILGDLVLDEGSRTVGASVIPGRLDQKRLTSSRTLLDVLASELPDKAAVEVRTLVAKFGLGPRQLAQAAGTLSPGERTRARLAVLQAQGANLLVLDEPTNHLDLEAVEQLESALQGFEGTLVAVTHDRALRRSLLALPEANTRRFTMREGRLSEPH